MSERGYTFGDTDVAGRRLRLAAEVFQPEMASFLAQAQASPELAYDLGCGPGYTTRIVARAVGPQRTIGLDASSRFVEIARGQAMPGVEYLEHDVTRTPFPCGPGDLLFSHFLLPHLSDPPSALAASATQLRAGGLLLLDEVSDIWMTHPVFLRYLEMVDQVVAAGGGRLYAGKAMEQLTPGAGLAVLSSHLVEHPVSTAQAAAMFRLNIAGWGATPTATAIFSAPVIAEVAAELDGLAKSTARREIVWGMRQVVCRAAIAA
ncbi:MAG: class I SAM-dependent methyltransferase [Chloroflexi bacterium]|nr:class I SAM-dependent methyltransferase [Chloroflexota bacterium]